MYCDGKTYAQVRERFGCCKETSQEIVKKALNKLDAIERKEIVAAHMKVVRRSGRNCGKVDLEEVAPYECPECGYLVTFRPCKICATRKAVASGKILPAEEDLENPPCSDFALCYNLHEEEEKRRIEVVEHFRSHGVAIRDQKRDKGLGHGKGCQEGRKGKDALAGVF
jgi:predicted Zn-ribbon and HTH transcriptional regulator